MGRRIGTLLVLALAAACVEAGPASASGFSAGTNIAGFLGGLAGLPPDPPWPAGLSDALDTWDNTERAWKLLEELKTCADAGLGSDACPDALWAGACTAFLELSLDGAPELNILGLPFEEICKGEPTLKCCKYDPATQDFCHSAFNTPTPINCEGNPYAPNAESYGPCLWDGDPLHLGCTCCGIAECFVPGCAPASLSDPRLAAWRADTFAKKLANSFLSAARSDPHGAADFAMLVGCTAHQDAMLGIAPFAFPDSLPTSPDPGADFHVNDNDPDDRYVRGLTTLAVRRVLGGIPNGIARWEAVSSRLWSDDDIAAEVATVGNADAILRRLLGPFGFTVLQGADRRLYKLLAVPLPSELFDADTVPLPSAPPNIDRRLYSVPIAGPNDSPYVAGCLPGKPPTIRILLSVTDNTATVELQVGDPLAARTPSGHYPAAVDWGDGRLQHVFLLSSTQPIVHSYAAAGSYVIHAWTVNAAGLVASAAAVAAVGAPVGAADPGPPTVAAVGLDLTAVTHSYAPPYLSTTAGAVDPGGVAYALGKLYGPAPVRAGGYADDRFTFPGTLAHFRATPVSALQLSTVWGGGNVVYSVQVILGDVHLTGWDGSVTTVHLSPADVQWTPAGAAYPVAPLIDPATGGLLLPAAGESISVRLQSGEAPFAGCRPLYAPGTPAMVTAGGGCQEQDSGRVWSLAAAAVNYAQAQAYCAGLAQGGVGGWRLPADDELIGAANAAEAGTYFAFPTSGVAAWTTRSWSGTSRVTRDLSTGGLYVTAETALATAVCVR